MSDLRKLLSEADRIPAPDLWPDIRQRRPRPPGRSRQVVAGAVALTLAASGIAVVSVAFLGDRERPPVAGNPAGMEVDPRVTAEVRVGEFPQEVAVGEGAVWVTVNDPEAPERWFVARIDPATNRVTDEIDLRDAVDVAVGAGSVWAITYDGATGWAVARIDPALRTITGVIPLDCHRGCGATQVAATDDAVWVTSSPDYPERGEVIRIDPLTNQVAARIAVTGDPRDLAVGEGGVWVYALTHFAHGAVAGGTLYRIDPSTNSLSATLLEGEVPPVAGISGPPVLTVGHGYVWTIRRVGEGPDEELVRIDPRTNQVEGLAMLGYFHPFAVGEGGVWLRASRQQGSVLPVGISRLNTQTLQLDESVGIDGLAVDAALDPEAGVIWLATYQGPVIRVDLRSDGGPSPEPTPFFEPSPGWNTAQAVVDPQGERWPATWVANVAFQDDPSRSALPNETVRGLPPGGIVITVVGPRPYTGGEEFPTREFPLRVSDGFCTHRYYEGQPAPHVSACQLDTWVEDRLLNVTVWLGREPDSERPSEELLSEADKALARLRIAGTHLR